MDSVVEGRPLSAFLSSAERRASQTHRKDRPPLASSSGGGGGGGSGEAAADFDGDGQLPAALPPSVGPVGGVLADLPARAALLEATGRPLRPAAAADSRHTQPRRAGSPDALLGGAGGVESDGEEAGFEGAEGSERGCVVA